MCFYVLFNFENLENIIDFVCFLLQLGKKTWFLALGKILKTRVGLIARKITAYISRLIGR